MKCPRCATENSEVNKFCRECGEKFSAGYNIIKPGPFREAERKRVTAFFSDMTGYSEITERLDPEEVKEITSRIFDGVREIVKKYDGYIERFAGDGFLALFGVPSAHEDDPIRAIQTAREIHQFVEARLSPQYEGKIGRTLSMHSGINTGLAVTADIDLETGTHGATGMAINVAARLSDIAKAREILTGVDTYKESKHRFNFKALEPAWIKGLRAPMPIFRVISTRRETPHFSAYRQIASEMVGRDQIIGKLELQVMKAIKGEGSVVNVIGEAGMGKSRLIAELRGREVMNRVTLLEGRAISIGRNFSFHPIIDLLKQWARISEEDSELKSLFKLEKVVKVVNPRYTNEILPFLATLMGMKLTGSYAKRISGIEGEALEKLIIKNIRMLLIQASELSPLVLVAEDMHWSDTSTIVLMESLFGLVETQSIVFMNIFRPGFESTGNRIRDFARQNLPKNYIELVIEPLDNRSTEVMINNILNLGGLDHAITEKIVNRTGGNPFFIEEVLRSLIDEGAVVMKNGIFELNEKIETIYIPPTISGVLMARIDRLEERTRDLLKIASVIGRTFFYRILREVADGIEDIDKRLDFLKETQLIRERERIGEVEYLFKHELAHDAVYESILVSKRKALHLKVAETIETLFNNKLHELYGMLAYHYTCAEIQEKAHEYLIKAGKEALRSSASNEALHYYHEALNLYLKNTGNDADLEKVAMLKKNIATALYNRCQYAEAVTYFEEALSFYWGKLPNHPVAIFLKTAASFLHLMISLYAPSVKFSKTPSKTDIQVFDLYYKKCKALAISNPKRFFIEFLFLHKKITAFKIQEIENGAGLFVSASPLFSFSGVSFMFSRKILDFVKQRMRIDDLRTSTVYELCETMHNFLKGNWKKIGRHDDNLINRNCDIGEIWEPTEILYWHGLPCIYQGNIEKAESIVSRLDKIFAVYQYDLAKTHEYEIKSCLLMESRRFYDALIVADKGIEFEKKSNIGFWVLYVCKAHIYIMLGEIEKAKEFLGQAKKICHKIQPVPFQIAGLLRTELEYNLSKLRENLKSSNKKGLFECRKNAIRSAKKLLRNVRKVAQYRTESYRLIGEYFWLIDKQKAALKWWHKAIKEGERLGARLQLAVVYFEVGKRLLETRSKFRALDGIDKKTYLEMAGSMFEEMNLQAYLDELSLVSMDKYPQ